MKFALVDGVRKTAEPKTVGKCICCNSKVRSYCGPERVHHWKHLKAIKCDSFSEGETEWHREWKNYFDINQQEVVKFNSESGEKHIADVYLEFIDLVFEFQHSPIHIDEIKARESFYKKMIWVVDVKPYKKNISFHQDIGDTFEKFIITPWINNSCKQIRELEKKGKLKEIDILMNDKSDWNYIKQLEKKYFPDYVNKSFKAFSARNVLKHLEEQRKLNPRIKGYMHSDEYMEKLKQMAVCHLEEDYILMVWRYQHKRWNYAELPLFFDIGDEFVYRCIENIKIWNGFIVKKYSKKYFVQYYKSKQNNYLQK